MLCSQFDTLSLRYASFDLIEKMSLFWSTPIISIITIQEATFSVKRRVLANHFTAGICYLSLFLKYTKGVTASRRSCYLYIILLSKWHFIQKLQKDLIYHHSTIWVAEPELGTFLWFGRIEQRSATSQDRNYCRFCCCYYSKSPIGKENAAATIFEKDLKQKRRTTLQETE